MNQELINYMFHGYVEYKDPPKLAYSPEEVIDNLVEIKGETDAHINFMKTGEFKLDYRIMVSEQEKIEADTSFVSQLNDSFDEIQEAISMWDTDFYEDPSNIDYVTHNNDGNGIYYPPKNKLKYWGELSNSMSADLYGKKHEEQCLTMLDAYFDEISPLTSQKMLIIFNAVDHEDIVSAIHEATVKHHMISSSKAEELGLPDPVIGGDFNRIATLLKYVGSTVLERSKKMNHIEHRILRRYHSRENGYGAEIKFRLDVDEEEFEYDFENLDYENDFYEKRKKKKTVVYYVCDFPPEEVKNRPTIEPILS